MNRHRSAWILTLALAAAAAVLSVVAACIPDLPSEAAVSAEGGLSPRCGDGIVQLDRGEQCDPGAAGSPECTAACRVACDGGFRWSRNDHCYLQAAAASKLSDANARCAALGGHLVTFASADELSAVVHAIDAGAFWVGMYEGVGRFDSVASLEPAWEPGCAGCFAQTADPSLPLPGASLGQACVEGSSALDASWQKVPCTGIRPMAVVCEREPPGRLVKPCPNVDGGLCLDVRFTFGKKHYVYFREAASRDEARRRCEALSGRLVVFESRDEREQIWKELGRFATSSASSGFWIGLSLSDDAGWTWDDGVALGGYAPPWAYHEPREGGPYAYVEENGGTSPAVDNTLAHTAAPDRTFPFVCQVDDGPTRP